LASEYGRYGYRRITILQEAGWQMGKDRVQCIGRREGLRVPQKQRLRGRLWLGDGSCVRLRPQHVLSDHDACGIGFIAQLGSTGSREVVQRALTALERLAHRGGVDADGTSGDGTGLLTAVPEKFIRARARQAGIKLPEKFAVGMAFLPRRGASRARAAIEGATAKVGFRCLG
jgi:hypothetical protein